MMNQHTASKQVPDEDEPQIDFRNLSPDPQDRCHFRGEDDMQELNFESPSPLKKKQRQEECL